MSEALYRLKGSARHDQFSDLACLSLEIDAMQDELKASRLALSAARTALAAKDAAYTLQSRQWDELQEKARVADSEREANAILTDEIDRLHAELAAQAQKKEV